MAIDTIRFNGKSFPNLTFGSQPIDSVYFGTKLIWKPEPTIENPPTIVTNPKVIDMSVLFEYRSSSSFSLSSVTMLNKLKEGWHQPFIKIIEGSISGFNSNPSTVGGNLESSQSRSMSFSQNTSNPYSMPDSSSSYYETTWAMSTPMTLSANTSYLLFCSIHQYLSGTSGSVGFWTEPWPIPHEGFDSRVTGYMWIDGNFGKWHRVAGESPKVPWVKFN